MEAEGPRPEAATESRDATGRFNYFSGVFTPSILTILGVVMYMLFGWVVGNVGLAGALIIVFVSHLISFATGLSVSSIATNRTVRAGGAYYMISRSLGSSTGAAIGIPLFVGQALSITFYVVGFTASLQQLAPNLPFMPVAFGTLLALTVITFLSTSLAIKTQYIVMAAIVLSLISFFSGSSDQAPESIAMWNSEGESFAKVFAVFFPAVTGIMAGVSMSGDLRDARKDLPRGTMLAILVGFIIYMVFPIWLAKNASSEAMINDPEIVWKISRIPALIFVGVWGATLSSALGSIMAAPRTLQALAMDGVVPRVFARGSGPQNEPRLGLLFSCGLAAVAVLLGSLDAIAPVLTMFFLVTYGVTNIACALERWAASPSFRPTFQVPALISFAGGVACFAAMAVINVAAMIGAIVICGLIFIATERRHLNTTFGDARHGIWSATVQVALQRLRKAQWHPMNWRPNVIILGGDPNKRRYLLELAGSIVQQRGIATYFHVLSGPVLKRADDRARLTVELEDVLAQDYPNIFYRCDVAPNVYLGAVNIAQSYGVGTFEANTVMLGWPRKEDRAEAYVDMLRDLTALNRSLLLVRYDKDRSYGRKKRVDIWWGGLQNNGGLMLLLAFLLKSDIAWRTSDIRVITVVNRAETVVGAQASLQHMIREARVDAAPHVIVRGGRDIKEIMEEESQRTDLAVIGFRFPADDEPAWKYFRHYEDLLSRLPTAVIVNSARDFEDEPVLFDA